MNGKMTILACITGFLLDCIFGDPVWMYHPIRVIGNLISVLEKGLRKLLCSRIHASEQEKKNRREVLAGGILWILTVSLSFLVPAVLLFAAGKVHPAVRFLLETFWCYQIFAARCLVGESKKVYQKLKEDDLPGARKAVSMIVGRDTQNLTEEGVTKAAVETVAENTSDGVIAPGYTEEALEILKTKKKGNYNIVKIDPAYVPAVQEKKQVFGITFEQGRNNFAINMALLENVVTENKNLPEEAKRDLIIALITLKYTQSNSVCFVKDGQAIGIGAGQQSRIHCTRLAGGKADNWWLRQSPQVMNLPFVDGIRRADRDNAIDLYIGEDYMDVLADDAWPAIFKEKPEVFTREAKREWLDKLSDVALGSDAFFPFGDNIERAHKSGVKYIAQPGGSVRDDNVIATCNKYGMVMSFTGIRLFHH